MTSLSKPALALYLHIPFCTAKCGYCDFNSYEGLEHLVPDYTPALVREIELWAPAARSFQVRTVFFGGGTPSLSSLEDLRALANAVRSGYDIAEDSEWSLEANPGELTREHLDGMRALGINRLSIGVQSLRDDELKLLDRIHTAERAIEAIADARAAGFTNLNLDLIFGLIDQPLSRWQDTLARAVALRPEHLSCYALTVEPGTALYYQVAKGQLSAPRPGHRCRSVRMDTLVPRGRGLPAVRAVELGASSATSADITSCTGGPSLIWAWARERIPSSPANASQTSMRQTVMSS